MRLFAGNVHQSKLDIKTGEVRNETMTETQQKDLEELLEQLQQEDQKIKGGKKTCTKL